MAKWRSCARPCIGKRVKKKKKKKENMFVSCALYVHGRGVLYDWMRFLVNEKCSMCFFLSFGKIWQSLGLNLCLFLIVDLWILYWCLSIFFVKLALYFFLGCFSAVLWGLHCLCTLHSRL